MNSNVPLSLGIPDERAVIIQRVVTTLIRADHSDEERISRIRDLFPRFEECIYAVYILAPEKEQVALRMSTEEDEAQDKIFDGTDMF